MDVMDAKVTGIAEKVEESVEYSRDIKNGLRSDILSMRSKRSCGRIWCESEDKVRKMIDNAEVDLKINENVLEYRKAVI